MLHGLPYRHAAARLDEVALVYDEGEGPAPVGHDALERFKYLAIILGTDFGSIISLGIGPIVMASIILQLLTMLFKVNIPKIIVLVGTFSLAMAFAGNDLVNFIGVPLAGLESYKEWVASGADPDGLLMTSLATKVKTPTIFLLGAGIIMALALWTSKKARTVTKTELSLSKQDEGSEMFESSSAIARSMVRIGLQFSNTANFIFPNRLLKWLDSRFDSNESDLLHKEADMSFDILRASINLVVAGVLIAYGTSQKLPLSTTYVTFMVSMGTSLADRAWGRASAVYRITGVMIVITGWFFTAMAAFTSAFLIALFINWAGMWAIGTMVIIVSYLLFRSYRLHGKRSSIKEESLAPLDASTPRFSTTRFFTLPSRLIRSSSQK